MAHPDVDPKVGRRPRRAAGSWRDIHTIRKRNRYRTAQSRRQGTAALKTGARSGCATESADHRQKAAANNFYYY